ncbi:MAG: hypothetical protein ACM3U1_08335 [Chloroflexota bacterium]
MKQIYLIALIASVIYACQPIVIGTPRKAVQLPDYDQSTAAGAVYLFKTELDSNNIAGAAGLVAKPGRKYLAAETLELYPKIARIKRQFGERSISALFVDTLSNDQFKIIIEFEDARKMDFLTSRIEDQWFIVLNEDK